MIHQVNLSQEEARAVLAQARSSMEDAAEPAFTRPPTGSLPIALAERIRSAAKESAAISIGPFAWQSADLVPTPSHEVLKDFRGSFGLAAHTLALVAQSLGRLVTYSHMKQSGSFVQQVFPVRGRENEESAASSLSALSWHTEHAIAENPPDWLALFCLRNPDSVGTRLAPLSVSELSSHGAELLAAKDACSFSGKFGTFTQPVISRHDGAPRFRFDPHFQTPRDAATSAAYQKLLATAEANAFVAPQKPGHILLFSNRHFAHGREHFQARFDGTDRWLLRGMVNK